MSKKCLGNLKYAITTGETLPPLKKGTPVIVLRDNEEKSPHSKFKYELLDIHEDKLHWTSEIEEISKEKYLALRKEHIEAEIKELQKDLEQTLKMQEEETEQKIAPIPHHRTVREISQDGWGWIEPSKKNMTYLVEKMNEIIEYINKN